MNLRTDTSGDIEILIPSGRLDSTTAPTFEKALLAYFEGRPARVLVDFDELEYISSAGLRVILMAAKRAKQSGGGFVLCGLHENIREVFEISGFLSILNVSDGRDEALARLAPT